MDIIIGADSLTRAEHARTVITKIAQQEADPSHPHRALPMGVAHHLARYPRICDDCGLTYWSRDEWGSHIMCKGVPPEENRKTGF